jgi:hypothetical protein
MRTSFLLPFGIAIAVYSILAFGGAAPTADRIVGTGAAPAASAPQPEKPAPVAYQIYGDTTQPAYCQAGDVLFAPNGDRIYGIFQSGGFNPVGWIAAWNLRTGKQELVLTEPKRRTQVGAFLPGGKRLLTSSLDDTLLAWDLETGESTPLRCWDTIVRPGRQFWVWNVKLSPDARTVACPPLPPTDTEPYEKGIALLDLASGRERGVIKGSADPWAMPFAFTSDNRRLVGADREGCAIWDLATGKIVRRLEQTAGVRSGALAPNERTVAVTRDCINPETDKSDSYNVKCLDLTAGKTLWRREVKEDSYFGHGAAAYSPDSRLLVTSVIRKPWLRVWDAATGDELAKFDIPMSTDASRVAFSADGKSLATGTSNGCVLVWDLTTLPFWKKLNSELVSRPTQPAHDAPALSKTQLNDLWNDLGAADAALAYRAMWALAMHGKDSLPIFRERLRPCKGPDAQVVAKLLAELDDPSFPTRERASAELRLLAQAIAPELRELKKSHESLEVRRRLEHILNGLNNSSFVSDGATLRSLRAVETLEHIGGPEAIELLRDMAKGAPGAPETLDAKFALQRLTAN